MALPTFALVALLLVAAPPVAPESSAASAAAAGPTKQVSLRDILEQQRGIRDGLARNDPAYADLDDLRRSRIAEAQARIFILGERAQAAGGLSADDQLELFNQLKKVEAFLTRRDSDDRMVCERTAIVGTRRYEMVCMSRADREAKADSVRKALMERRACTTQQCIGGD